MADNVDVDGVQVRAILDDRGREVGDPVPMAPPVGVSRPLTLAEQLRLMVRRELSAAAADQGFETFEDADDFDIDDDPLDPHTVYEAVFDPQPNIGGKDGSAESVDQGGNDDSVGRDGGVGKVGKDDAKSVGDAGDKRDVSETVVSGSGGKG